MALDAVSAPTPRRTAGQRRLYVAYPLVLLLCVVGSFLAFRAGGDEARAPGIAGTYALEEGSCLGTPGSEVSVRQSGRFVDVEGAGASGGKVTLDAGTLRGTVTCADGTTATLEAQVPAEGAEGGSLEGTAAGGRFALSDRVELPAPGSSARAEEHRPAEETFGRLMLAIAAVILAARLVRVAIARLGEPPVMGEVLAGILLGPTLLGTVAPDVQDYLFPGDIIPLITAASFVGLAFYMFLVGLELDPKTLEGRVGQAVITSNSSVAFAMMLGILVAIPLYSRLAPPTTSFTPFALFMGVSMSITAFPVLARILVDRRMLKRPTGAMALATAAIDDVTAWALLALATAIALTGSGIGALKVLGYLVLFCVFMGVVVRRLLMRVSAAYDEAGQVPVGWIAAIFVGVLLSAFLAVEIGINAIFGAFVMGLIMPRRADLSHDVSRRLEDFVVTVLLPLFFVVTGLRTEIGALNRPELWLITLLLIGVAIIGKGIAVTALARLGGFGLREGSAFGALMNTRGLTELIVLNIALDLGVISPALFTMLVIMALVTTFMTGPLLKLLDPKGTLSAAPEEELLAATRAGRLEQPLLQRSIVVASQNNRNLDHLLELAEPLARAQPPRELLLVRLVVPQRLVTALASDDRELRQASEELEARRRLIAERGVDVRAVAYTTPDASEDLVRVASQNDVDLLLLDGRRPLLGAGVPRGEIGAALEKAPCDVAVLVEREGAPTIDAGHPVIVPFGGAEHDWAALELGAWIAAARGANLKLLGAASSLEHGGRDASRLLANASLVVQQLTGIVAEPVLARPGRDVIDAAEGAGLLVVGLPERWREEGLGPLRAEIVKSAPAPTLLVRRGSRPGALASRDDVTRFRWSSAGQAVR